MPLKIQGKNQNFLLEKPYWIGIKLKVTTLLLFQK